MFKEADYQMEARTGIAIALLLVGCAQPQVSDGDSEPIVAVSPTVAPRPAPQQQGTPRRLKLRLTLDRPENLKVKVGDGIVKGQVISDRRWPFGDHHTSTRTKLTREREALQQQLKQLQVQVTIPSYAVEKAEVEQARLRVKLAKVAIANFHADSPWTDYARQVLPLSESTQLGELEAGYQEAKGELAIAIAKFQKAQRQGAMKGDSSGRQGELLGKMRELERQLDEVVRSPYAGVVKKIKWLGQVNQELGVELSLEIGQSDASQKSFSN
jgi:hypothetical protein